MNGRVRPTYLDYNATIPVLPEVLDPVLPFLRERLGNPSSLHELREILFEQIRQDAAHI